MDFAGAGFERDDALEETDGTLCREGLMTRWFVCPSTATSLSEDDRERWGLMMLDQSACSTLGSS